MERRRIFSIAILALTNRRKTIHRSRTKIMLFSLAICIAAACLAPTTIGDYSISPETKGWAVQDITDESYTILITNLYSHSTIQVQAIPTPFTFIDNVSVFRPVPPELWQYITVTPEELNLGFGESGSFTVHVAFPDLAEMYNHTWEYRILMNDTNPYNYEAGGPSLTQKMHILRLYLPKTKPIVVAETPFYIYPFMIVFALIFLGGIVIYLKKRSVPRTEGPRLERVRVGRDGHLHCGDQGTGPGDADTCRPIAAFSGSDSDSYPPAGPLSGGRFRR